MSSPVVGILGAGQLGLMLAQAAQPLGIRCVLLDPASNPPAKAVARVIKADYEDRKALATLAKACTVLTYEFENVPHQSAVFLEETGIPVFPSSRALAIAQDRLDEKNFFKTLKIPTAKFFPVRDDQDIDLLPKGIVKDGLMKTRRMGYDGKGQMGVSSPKEALEAFKLMGGVPCLVEEKLTFQAEVSLLCVRSSKGEIGHYPLVENEHKNGILHQSLCPASPALQGLQKKAEAIGEKVLKALDFVGVLCLEFFVVDGKLLVNEMAPRVHNSGHFSIEGSQTSQFENHLRAILGWPLGSTECRGLSGMLNIIGTMPPKEPILAISGANWHDYGKEEKPGRKLAHLTLTASTAKARKSGLQRIAGLMSGVEG